MRKHTPDESVSLLIPDIIEGGRPCSNPNINQKVFRNNVNLLRRSHSIKTTPVNYFACQ
jgi:hypothetical protein